jgi:spore germination protein
MGGIDMNMKMTKKRMFYTLTVTMIVVFSTTFAILMTLERNDYRNYLQGEYSKSMYELMDALENIEDNLSKSAITATKEQRIVIFDEIFRHASIADDRLHSLPVPQETINGTAKFLTQVGDYSYTLVKSSMNDNEITDDQYASIDNLREQSYNLKSDLNNLLADINEGRVKWGEIRKKASGVFAKNEENLISGKFETIQKQVVQYPTLIYDGPFSDNILEMKPRVNDMEIVSEESAREVVKKALGNDKIESLELRTVSEQATIDVYSFNVKMKGRKAEENVVCEISKHGGKLVYILDSRAIGQPTISQEKAAEEGTKFLNDLGYTGMVSSYVLTYEDTIIVNYVYHLNDIPIYTDQINLKIALDNGAVTGVVADKYLVTHVTDKQIQKAKLSQEQANEKVSKRLNVENVRLAVIPSDTNKEILCYEYKGTYNDDTFLVYVNAESGEPERILKIVNTPNGQMTI